MRKTKNKVKAYKRALWEWKLMKDKKSEISVTRALKLQRMWKELPEREKLKMSMF